MLAEFARASAFCRPEKLSPTQPQSASRHAFFQSLVEHFPDRPAVPASARLIIHKRCQSAKRPKSAVQLEASGNGQGPIKAISEPIVSEARPSSQREATRPSKVTFGEARQDATTMRTAKEEGEADDSEESPSLQIQQEQQRLREARIERAKKRLLHLAQAQALMKCVKERIEDQDISDTTESCASIGHVSGSSQVAESMPTCADQASEQKQRAKSLMPELNRTRVINDDAISRRQSTPAQVCTNDSLRSIRDESTVGPELDTKSRSASATAKLPFERTALTRSTFSATSATQGTPTAEVSRSCSAKASAACPAFPRSPRSSGASGAEATTSRRASGTVPRPSLRPSLFNACARASLPSYLHNPVSAKMSWEHERCKQRQSVNKAIQKKLRAFDVRRQQEAAAAQQKEKESSGDFEWDSSPKQNAQNRKEDVELGFHIVGWSSQKGRCEATRLLERRGKWESNTHTDEVHNEYLVFGLHGLPCAVTGIDMTMGGTSANPKRCRMQYSEASQNGPWLDAWSFVIEPAGALNYRSRHQYGLLATQFRNLVLSYCGSFEVAWYLFDINESGVLSKADFEIACVKFQDRFVGATIPTDLQRIFREFDPTGAGEVPLDDILNDSDPRLPMAPWWRLLIVDNFGSPNSVMLMSPLKLFSTELASEEAAQTRKGGVYQQTLFMEGMVAAHQDVFHTSPEMRMLRRTAKQHELPLDKVEAFRKEFLSFSPDGDYISRPEFDKLLLKLHGFGERNVLPLGRLEFFWRQADEDGSGTIDFEELLVWYFKKSPLIARK